MPVTGSGWDAGSATLLSPFGNGLRSSPEDGPTDRTDTNTVPNPDFLTGSALWHDSFSSTGAATADLFQGILDPSLADPAFLSPTVQKAPLGPAGGTINPERYPGESQTGAPAGLPPSANVMGGAVGSTGVGTVGFSQGVGAFGATVPATASVPAPQAVSASVFQGSGGGGDASPLAPLNFTVETSPNNSLALNNTFVAQADPVEYLAGWMVRYTAPAGVQNVQWWTHRPGAKDVVFAQGNPVEGTATGLGTYSVYFTGTQNGAPVTSGQRTEVAGDVSSPAGVKGFNVADGGAQYVRSSPTDPTHPENPQQFAVVPHTDFTPAIQASGEVDLAAGSPGLTKFAWGFIQSDSENLHLEYDLYDDPTAKPPISSHTWAGGTTPGTTLTVPKYFFDASAPDNTNDSYKGHILYGESNGNPLGRASQIRDLPSFATMPPGSIYRSLPDSNHNIANVHYQFTHGQSVSQQFIDWLVVYNTQTNQYVPLRQGKWSIVWDSSTAQNTWTVTGSGFVGETAVNKMLSDGTKTTTDDYQKTGSDTLTPPVLQTFNFPN